MCFGFYVLPAFRFLVISYCSVPRFTKLFYNMSYLMLKTRNSSVLKHSKVLLYDKSYDMF